MKVLPLNPQKPRPVALLIPGWHTLQALTVEGELYAEGPERCWQLGKKLEGHVAYTAGSLRPLIHTTGAPHWSADIWRGRATTMHLAGTKLKVRSLRRTLDSLQLPAEQFTALLEVMSWLSYQGVSAGSISSMAWNIWRSTLPGPLSLGFSSKVGRQAMYGGRQESSRPATLTDQVSLDISSAYPFAMASRPYAGMLREVSRDTTLDPEVAGIAKAAVLMPDELRFPALPIRLAPGMIQWRWGELEGTWTWGELEAARQLGATVQVQRCWAPATTVEPFAPWWELMARARADVSPAASTLVKSLTNTLFGTFAMNGDERASCTWLDELGERPERVRSSSRAVPQTNTVHIAAETTARVRTRMLLEGLYGDEGEPCHIDTDGIIVSRESAARRLTGSGPGQWRHKNWMAVVEVKGPQVYRWKGSEGPWQYVVSGVNARKAPDLFESLPTFQVAISGLDTVVPSSHWLLDSEQIRRYNFVADKIERTLYGPRIDV